ncbi:hybrid sensor histidine kinase/response regulator [Ghiorsea bivora]|uniref:hybrid sensor histidine kinase/response regulator n=1 Tax=Ghiorsea bivora TaxID=1485545 RepID=UPI0018E0806B|nr:PAS domain-containing sensor histidine kinase [Ghiorsea bivora]
MISSIYVGAQQQLADMNLRLFQEQLSNLSLQVVRDLRQGEVQSAQRFVSVAAASDTIEHLSVVDKSGKIINATHYTWLGKQAKDVIPDLNNLHFTTALKNHHILSDVNTENAEGYIYYPIDMSASFQAQDLGQGLMIGKFTFKKQAMILQREQQQQLMYFAGLLVLVALLFFMFMRKAVTQPLAASMRFIQGVEQGKGTTTLKVQGTKEVAHLAESLSSMHAALRKSQTSLTQTNILLNNILESVPDLVFLKDTEGVYLGCNHAFCTLVGKASEADVVGCTDFDFFEPAQAKQFAEHDKRIFTQGESLRSETWVAYPDGRKGLFDTLKSPYRNAQGELLGLIGISRDVTDIKDLEAQFHQAQKMEAIGTLVGGIAHDFNNILAAMTGNMYLAKRSMLQGDVAAAVAKVERIEGLSDKAATMIAQLLSFSRKGVMQKEKLSMQAFVQESLQLAKVTIPENVHVKHNIEDESMMVYADSSQLQQVLMNLLNNARDAVEDMPEPTISVTLHTYIPSENFKQKHGFTDIDRLVHLCVQDNGCGIAEEDVKYIFDPFFTTKDVDKGTGLGLSMVYGAILSHHGVVEVESQPGEGASFHVYLPTIKSDQDKKRIQPRIQMTEANGEVILLADDEVEVRQAMAEVLETMGYRVYQASDGEQAFVIFKEHYKDIALVMVDVVMPKLGGVQLVQVLRDIKSQVPVILMTGYDKNNVLKIGSIPTQSQILTKPIHFDVLQDAIYQLLHRAS